jgi:hypothetical protein
MFNQVNESSQQIMQKMKNYSIPSVAITRLKMHNKQIPVTVIGLQLQHQCQVTLAAQL